MLRVTCILAAITIATTSCEAMADALVVTSAMKASTIVEVFVEEERIRVKLEVGVADLPAFRNVLPDDLYEKLTNEKRPLAERFSAFVEQDWVITADDQRLEARLESIAPAKRLVRDDVTGEPLMSQPDDAAIVLQVELSYALKSRPASLSLGPPLASTGRFASANIGFVVYHLGVAVNDFRYLSRAETLHLDWTDPWYSRFNNKNLWRRYSEPAAAFLYVENFEVRKEIIFRPKDLQAWVDLGLDGASVIRAEERASIATKAAAFLHEHTPLEIDGKAARGTLDRVHFISRTLRSSGVVEPDRDIDINVAILGAIFVYSIDSLPRQATMDWNLFNDRIARVPTVASDEAGGLPSYLEPEDATLVWKNYLTSPTLPTFIAIPPPPEPRRISIPVVSLLCLAVVAAAWMRRRFGDAAQATSPAPVIVCSLLLIGTAASAAGWMNLNLKLPGADAAPISDEDASSVAQSLLQNLYHAFDYRGESRIYDVLDRSVSGDLLTRIYLETQQSLTLASQGGARVKVKAVEMLDCQTEQAAGNGSFKANCNWNVTGSVGHWGHIHQRKNQYHADFVIQAVDGQWKIINMQVLSEERL